MADSQVLRQGWARVTARLSGLVCMFGFISGAYCFSSTGLEVGHPPIALLNVVTSTDNEVPWIHMKKGSLKLRVMVP